MNFTKLKELRMKIDRIKQEIDWVESEYMSIFELGIDCPDSDISSAINHLDSGNIYQAFSLLNSNRINQEY